MRRTLLLGLLPTVLAAAGEPSRTVNWPCVQRYVPTIAGGTLWPDFVASDAWHTDPAMSSLVSTIASRSMPLDQAGDKLRSWIASHPAPDEHAQLFAGLVATINEARGAAIARIGEIDRRLQALSDANGRTVAELAAVPVDAPDTQREAITERRQLIIREFVSINRMVRYACEIPPDYDARLGLFARTLQPPVR